MRKTFFLIACLCGLTALLGCAAKQAPATEQAKEGNKCEAIAASEEWFRELMKTAAENISPATDDLKCPCYATITCEGVKYCSAHRCIDGNIHDPWKVRE